MNLKYVPFSDKNHAAQITQKLKYISGFEMIVVFLHQLLENVM